MITSKQRAYLRGIANDIPAIMQVGKGGLSENLVKTCSDALEARELIKLHILDNNGGKPPKNWRCFCKPSWLPLPGKRRFFTAVPKRNR